MSDQVIIDFIGDKTQLDATRAKAKSELEEMAKAPVKVPVAAAAQGPTFTYYRDLATAVKRTDAEIAAEKKLNADAEIRLEQGKTERLKAAQRAAAAESFGIEEKRLRELSVIKHQEYLADKAAQEGVTDTTIKESEKRLSRIRGLSNILQVTGLNNYGINESTLNVGVDIYNNIAKAKAAGAAADAASAAAKTEEAGAATVAAAATTEEAAAAVVVAGAATETAVATTVISTEAAAVAVSFATAVAVFLPLVAAGAIFVLWTKSVREESERRLKLENAISAESNAVLLHNKELTEEFQKQLKTQKEQQGLTVFKGGLEGLSVEQLTERRDRLKQIVDLQQPLDYKIDDKTGKGSFEFSDLQKRNQKELLELNDQIFNKQQEQQKTSFDSYRAISEAQVKMEKDRAEAFAKGVEEATKRVQEATKAATASFGALERNANSDNPFVRQMLDNADAVKKFKEEAKLLPPELQSVGYALVKQASDLATYKLRVDASFTALDLRQAARKFSEPTKQDQQSQLDRDFAEFQRVSNSTNPDVLRQFQEKQAAINNLDARKTQDNLDEQLKLARAARNPEERAVVEARIAASARGLDSNSLRADQRVELSNLFQSQAQLTEQREARAQKIREDTFKIWDDISKNGIKLQGDVAAGGKQVLDIRLTDNLKNNKLASAATQSDTKELYDLGQFDIVGGTNL